MLEIKNISTIPNTWILLFQFNNSDDIMFLNCENILSFPYAKELVSNVEEFQKVKKHKTKVSWNNERMDICIDKLIEDGKKINLH